MIEIPFTHFEGFVKQMDVSNLSVEYQFLFSKMFPRFYDKKDWTWDENNEIIMSMMEIPEVILAQPMNYRRYGGYALPRKRYSALSNDPQGNDGGTLTNELRAYRDPVRTGMVEVLDFGLSDNFTLRAGDKDVSFKRSQEIGVIIHKPNLFKGMLDNLQIELIQSEHEISPVLIRFPYSINKLELSKTVDLRLPQTREWFAHNFSKPLESWVWPEKFKQLSEAWKATTIYSKYKVIEERAPIPEDFNQMLPTLLNPMLGGGDSEWGGNTLMGIGEWLRNEGVEGFIYPSSRCDVVSAIQNGSLVNFEGWCIIDYRYSEEENIAHYTVFDQRPWCWVSLPLGVRAHLINDDPEWGGSFLIEGAVESGRKEYLRQIASLIIAEELIGPKQLQFKKREAFAIGVYSLKWVLQARIGLDYEAIYDSLKVFEGLVLRNGIDYLSGEAETVFQELVSGGDFKKAAIEMIEVANRAQSYYSNQNDIGDVLGAGIDLELILMALTNSSLNYQKVITSPLSAVSLDKLDLPQNLKNRVSYFLEEISKIGNNVEKCSILTVELHEVLAAHYSNK